jgi:hypothetical protein
MEIVDVSGDVLQKAIGTDAMTFAWLHPIVTTPSTARYVLLIERRLGGTGGDLLVVGVNERGKAIWYNGIEKLVTFNDYRHGNHTHFVTIGSDVVGSDTLEVLYRESFPLNIRRIRLSDGVTVGEDQPVIESTKSAFPMLSTATWLRDHDIIMFSKHGTFGAEFYLNRVRY